MIRLGYRGADYLPVLVVVVLGLCAGVLAGVWLVRR